MKTKFSGILTLLLALVVQITFAQESSVTGKVTDENDMPLPGATVVIKGTSTGVSTDFDGIYSISVSQGEVLEFRYVGYGTKSVTVGADNVINAKLSLDNELDEVVVTALGIKREKKSLGYATQEVDGETVSKVKSQNFVNSLTGKVAGLAVKPSGTMGGSTNVVIRGSSSILGNNQALFVVDGVPIDNNNSNSADQKTGRGGYDYGNAASDINPDDIESINVLKGAAASALYGSRASNGVVMITTKKGSKQKGIGVTINSSLTLGTADKETLPVYQKKYGAGYGLFYGINEDGPFDAVDVNGDGILDDAVPFYEDASYGGAFDSNKLVYQWNSLYPKLDTYQQATPWVAGENDPNYIWKTSSTATNSIDLSGGSDKGAFRLGFTNLIQKGNLPNSEIVRNSINFNGSLQLIEKLTASTSFNFIKTDGRGRYGTGYDDKNIMQQHRQWWQTNVDMKAQKDAYFQTRENVTWNPKSATDLTPIFTDNAYWQRYENYETDTRNRYYGNVALDYEIFEWLSAVGRFSFDTYSELQEERVAIGSHDVASYSRFNNNVAEYNYDLMLNFNKDLTDKLNLSGIVGLNLRRNEINNIRASTNGGLNLPGLYALLNSASPINAPIENESVKMVDGIYGQASFGYDNLVYLEGTYRTDRSSSLPILNNRYNYYSVTGSLIFSQLVEANWLSFGKVRANYGVVGNDTDPYNVFTTFDVGTPYNGGAIASNSGVLNNDKLLPEEQENWEIGLEMQLLNKRLGFDVSYYDALNKNQITKVPLSNSTGYTSALYNAGTISNKGWEVSLNVTPIRTEDFSWDVTVNWATNESLVVELRDGIDNLQLASFNNGVSINATPGEPYGTIRGTDFVYHDNGERIIVQTGAGSRTGKYQVSDESNIVIGNINPDWKGGVNNSFNYRNFNLSFLIDIQKGGDVYSVDNAYGFATGLYDFSAENNELGNPSRNPITGTPGNYGTDTGGILLPGVAPDGTTNAVRASNDTYHTPWGYTRNPNAAHVYDAGFVKLREASISYNFDAKTLDRLPFTGATVSLIGRNLWIIDKSTPYADPEAGLSSGNIQGIHSGTYPSIREIGASLKLQF